MKKYFHVLSLSMKNQINYLPSFLVQNVFFVLIIFIMYCLWSVIYSGKPVIEGLTLTQTIWYLTFTEAVELSRSNILKDMQVQVKDGSIAYMMGRPYSYVFYNLFEALGHSLIKLGPILCAGFILGVVFCGMLPGYFTHLPFGLVLFTGGLVLKILWCINIALLAFWMEEVTPFYWILQKLIFILGGMFFPIHFLPHWLQQTARYLPFAFSAYWPGIVMVDFSFESFYTGAAGQAVYIIILSGLAMVLFGLGKRRIHVQGG